LKHDGSWGVLKALFRLFSLIEYDYSIIDSTKLADWVEELHELFLDVRVKDGCAMFPVHAPITN
jgi:hypothetical protein